MIKLIDIEEQFIEIQTSIVSLCMEYVESKASKIYFYATNEEDIRSVNVFFEINNMIVKKNKVNDALKKGHIDIDKERMLSFSRLGREDWDNLLELLITNNQDAPTEMKLEYDVKKNKLNTKFQYENVYFHEQDLAFSDIFTAWYNEVKADNEEKMNITKNKRF